jgi:ribosomal protein L21E
MHPRQIRLRRKEVAVPDHALPGRCPHIRYIKVGLAVVIIIEPGRAHARPDILYPGRFGAIAKVPVPIYV